MKFTGNSMPSDSFLPVAAAASVACNTNLSTTLVADRYYTVVSTCDFWWKWGATATVGEATNGFWPAGVPLPIYTGANVAFAQIKDTAAIAGYLTFYRHY